MHLEGPWLSTTRTKARGEKTTKAQREELERDWRARNVRLKQMGLQKESFEQFLEWVYGRGKAVAQQTNNRAKVTTPYAKVHQASQGTGSSQAGSGTTTINGFKSDKAAEAGPDKGSVAPRSLGLWITGPCSSKPSPVYTGTKVKGIGTMHKSNAVPIFSDEEAIDISRMRR
jgi:hypothetical protein